jgi:hypothetical protein
VIRPLLFFALASAATGKTLTDQFHHLRNAEPREWSHYPQRAEGPRLQLSFDLGDDLSSYQLLTLRQAGIKEAWPVVLNGRRLGELERDHNDQELALVVPAGVLKTVGNLLEIATGSTVPDDIRVGEIELHCQSLQALTTGAGLSIAVTDADGGRALPCRLTIADARSQSLALLRVQPADGIAARAGVIYTLDGRAEIGLRPGRYKVWAGRGFEYSLASSEIELGVGGRAEIALQLRREVPTPGLVACDTHLHTGEFAGHGDRAADLDRARPAHRLLPRGAAHRSGGLFFGGARL